MFLRNNIVEVIKSPKNRKRKKKHKILHKKIFIYIRKKKITNILKLFAHFQEVCAFALHGYGSG